MSSPCPVVRGPKDLPDLRLWLIERWRPGEIFDTASQVQKIRHGSTNMVQARSESDWATRMLSEAQLWWVTDEACDVLANAAPTWDGVLDEQMSRGFEPDRQGSGKKKPGEAAPPIQETSRKKPKRMNSPVTEDKVLVGAAPPTGHSSGFAVFARGLTGQDVMSGQPLTVSAVLWGPVTLQPDPTRVSSSWTHGVGINSYSWLDEISEFPEELLEDVPHMLCPIGRSDWPFGDGPVDPISQLLPPEAIASMAEDRRLAAALWALPGARGIVDVESPQLDRATRRRSERDGIDPSVRVITLRYGNEGSQPATDTGGDGRDIVWRHRWMVTPHFRAQPYGPGRQQRKQILIGPYMKGPEGAPVLGTDRVWRIAPRRAPKE